MGASLRELCKYMEECTEKLEQEIKMNIDSCTKLLLANEATEVKLALEKAKDYHYKEILDYLKEIVTNIKKIVYHEEKIRSFGDEKSLPIEELRRYSHVQRQISVFSNNGEIVTKREKRRVASEISIGSLQAWENYLEQKSQEEKIAQVEKSELQKRRPNSKRRKKKFVSSTFNNFLDSKGNNRKLDSILENSTQEDLNDETIKDYKHENRMTTVRFSEESLNDDDKVSLDSYTESADSDDGPINCDDDNRSSIINRNESVSDHSSVRDCVDRKPKIVEVIYKKREGK